MKRMSSVVKSALAKILVTAMIITALPVGVLAVENSGEVSESVAAQEAASPESAEDMTAETADKSASDGSVADETESDDPEADRSAEDETAYETDEVMTEEQEIAADEAAEGSDDVFADEIMEEEGADDSSVPKFMNAFNPLITDLTNVSTSDNRIIDTGAKITFKLDIPRGKKLVSMNATMDGGHLIVDRSDDDVYTIDPAKIPTFQRFVTSVSLTLDIQELNKVIFYDGTSKYTGDLYTIVAARGYDQPQDGKAYADTGYMFKLIPKPGYRIREVKAGSTVLETEYDGYYAIADITYEVKVNVYIEKILGEVKAVKITGFTDHKLTLKQGDPKKTYPVTFEGENIDKDGIRVTISGDGIDDRYLEDVVRYEQGSAASEGSLITSMRYLDDELYHRVPEEGSVVRIQFYYCGNAVGEPYEITVAKQTLTKPALTPGFVSDADVQMSIKKPEALSGVENLWYEVKAVAKTPVKTGMLEESVKYVPVTSMKNSVDCSLKLSQNGKKGEGTKQKYTLSVRLVQVEKQRFDLSSEVQETDVIQRGPVVAKDIETKKPSYATSISLTAKTQSFYPTSDPVTLAAVSFSKNTSVNYYSHFINTSREDISDSPVIVLKDPKKSFEKGRIHAGINTLTVESYGKGSIPVKDKITFTVKQPITDLDVTVPSTRVYITNNKSTTFVAKAVFNKGETKPASTKVKWSIVDRDGKELSDEDDRKKYLAVTSAGKVAIKKGFPLTGNDYMDSFRVLAKADDYPANTVCGMSPVIVVSGSTMTISDISIWDGHTERSSAQGSELDNLSVRVNGKEVTADDFGRYAFTTNSKDFKYALVKADPDADPQPRFVVSKPGKYTLKVTAKDTRKVKKTISFEVKKTVPESYQLTVSCGYVPVAFDEDRTVSVNDVAMMDLHIKAVGAKKDDFVSYPKLKKLSALLVKKSVLKTDDEADTQETVHNILIRKKTKAKFVFDNKTYNIIINRSKGSVRTKKIHIKNGYYRDKELRFDVDTEHMADGNDYYYDITEAESFYTLKGKKQTNYETVRDYLQNKVFPYSNVTIDHNKATFSLADLVDSAGPNWLILPSGSYEFYINLVKMADGKKVSFTKPQKIKVYIDKPGTMTPKLVSKYIDIKDEPGAVAEIKIRKMVNNDYYFVTGLSNYNRAGSVNRLTDFFDVDPHPTESNKFYLKVKDNVDLGKLQGSDMIGYLHFQCYNANYYPDALHKDVQFRIRWAD